MSDEKENYKRPTKKPQQDEEDETGTNNESPPSTDASSYAAMHSSKSKAAPPIKGSKSSYADAREQRIAAERSKMANYSDDKQNQDTAASIAATAATTTNKESEAAADAAAYAAMHNSKTKAAPPVKGRNASYEAKYNEKMQGTESLVTPLPIEREQTVESIDEVDEDDEPSTGVSPTAAPAAVGVAAMMSTTAVGIAAAATNGTRETTEETTQTDLPSFIDNDTADQEDEYIPQPGAERVDAEGYLQSPESDEDSNDEEAIPIAKPVDMYDEEEASESFRDSHGTTHPSSDTFSSNNNNNSGQTSRQGQEAPAWLGDNIAIAVRDSSSAPEYKTEDKSWRGKFQKHKRLIIFLCLAVIASIVTGVVISLTTKGSPSPSPAPAPTSPQNKPTATPTMAPTTNAPTSTRQGEFRQGVFSDYDIPPRSAQSRALEWLADDDTAATTNQNLSEDRLKQRFALATLYYSTGGDSTWKNQLDFLTEKNECDWNDDTSGTKIGVAHCDENDMVTELNFGENDLNGTLPPEIATLTSLRVIRFLNNQNLTGSIPPEITNLTDLHHIDLSKNQLTGSLPSNIGNLVNLTTLIVEFNKISGPIPESIGGLVHLETIDAEGNELTGPLPKSMSQLTSLKSMQLSDNKLSGVIPSELSALGDTLRNIWLNKNDITGGMNTFCNSDRNLFYADCLPSAFPTTDAEVECECCTLCCNDGSANANSNCMPN